jgi:formylglycine-generating enzyme required for sulfatase activity
MAGARLNFRLILFALLGVFSFAMPARAQSFVEPEMVVVPGGSFVMGAPAGEENRSSNEDPRRKVTIRAFAVSKYEVTFAQWDACVAGGGCNGYRPDDLGWGRGDLPVINVSWDDVQSYLAWINGRAGGQRFRLLTEAEWEYAARAGSKAAFAWGASPSHKYANYGAETCCAGFEEGADRWVNTAPVGSFPANAFGLHDMAGNVWEWVQDCYADSYAGAPSDGSANEASCTNRVYRGGSWYFRSKGIRSAGRYWGSPKRRYNDLGFRLARSL